MKINLEKSIDCGEIQIGIRHFCPMADTGIRTNKRKRPATFKRIRNQRRCRIGFCQIADYFFALAT